jgi:hypothetical protein
MSPWRKLLRGQPGARAAIYKRHVEDTRRVITAHFNEGRGPARRDAHAFDNGCVRAIFQVDEHLPDDLCQGVFVRGRQYQAWIRFSNGNSVRRPGWMFDARGMATSYRRAQEADGRREAHAGLVLISHPSSSSMTQRARKTLSIMRGDWFAHIWCRRFSSAGFRKRQRPFLPT